VQENLSFIDAVVQVLHVRGAVCRYCSAGTHSRYKTLCVSLWQQHGVIIEEVSKTYHQNFLLCNNNEITACTADLFNSFCEEVYAFAFLSRVSTLTRDIDIAILSVHPSVLPLRRGIG